MKQKIVIAFLFATFSLFVGSYTAKSITTSVDVTTTVTAPITTTVIITTPIPTTITAPTPTCSCEALIIPTKPRPPNSENMAIRPPNSNVTVQFCVRKCCDKLGGVNFTLLYDPNVVEVINVSANQDDDDYYWHYHDDDILIYSSIDNNNGITKVAVISVDGIYAWSYKPTPIVLIKLHIVGSTDSHTYLNLSGVEFSDFNCNVFKPYAITNGSIKVGIKGDYNGNYRIDIGDVFYVARMVVDKSEPDISADFNGNGKIDIGDLAKIAYYLIGKINKL